MGGDCSVDLAPMSYLRQRYGPRMMVAYIDAHADLNEEWETPSGHFHGAMAICGSVSCGACCLTRTEKLIY